MCEASFAAGDAGDFESLLHPHGRNRRSSTAAWWTNMWATLSWRLFGAPLAEPDDADRAMETALEMAEALDELNRQWQKQRTARYQRGDWDQYRRRRRWQHGIGDSAQLHRDRRRCESGLAVGRINETSGVRNADHYQRINFGKSEETISHPAPRRSRGQREAKVDGNLCAARPRMISIDDFF